MRRLASGFLALLLFAAVPALAQEEPPGRVGRVSLVEGQLSFHLADETQWSEAAVNYPVATGGSFWTDPQSRAEIRVGAQTINLANNTELGVVKLNDEATQLSVPQGRIGLHVRQLAQGNTVQVDIPRGAVWLLAPGVYDIDAGTADQPARVTVFEGSARFVGGTLDLTINNGDAAVISGTDTLAAAIERATPDAFVQWCRSRDYRQKRLAAPKYVSTHMTGYEELDDHGSWAAAPQYGQVWYPRSVPADWAPYREGHWVSIQPWGMTWVDSQPWGFAPFHYGRWARIQGRWGWVPGRVVPRPVYAPALVAFIGQPEVGFAVPGAREPAVGWFPLAPNEVYVPSYSRNVNYIRNVNITNVSVTKITNVTNIIVNRPAAAPPVQVVQQNFANRTAATVVPVKAIAEGAKVKQVALQVPPQTLQKAPVSVQPPKVTPAAVRPAPSRPADAPAAVPPKDAPPIRPPGVATTTTPGKPPVAAQPDAATKAEPGKPPVAAPPGTATKAEPGKPPVAAQPGAATKAEPGKPPVAAPPGTATKAEPGKPPVAAQPGAATKAEPGKPPVAAQPGAATKAEPGKPPVAAQPGAATKAEPGKPPVAAPPGAATKAEPGKPPVAAPLGAATRTEPGKPPGAAPPGAATRTEPGKPPVAATRTEPG
ncbi:MAG TPA: DUF6600 domain-containing protein, partial [Stellaceae bacterium]|nr:DUF6600 domain-containing protein [Stellaceae bacterium]